MSYKCINDLITELTIRKEEKNQEAYNRLYEQLQRELLNMPDGEYEFDQLIAFVEDGTVSIEWL